MTRRASPKPGQLPLWEGPDQPAEPDLVGVSAAVNGRSKKELERPFTAADTLTLSNAPSAADTLTLPNATTAADTPTLPNAPSAADTPIRSGPALGPPSAASPLSELIPRFLDFCASIDRSRHTRDTLQTDLELLERALG